tara:strand:+ start:1180 stop:1956 length:777 start_codon:yes stop_codon:yes gene_type:complete
MEPKPETHSRHRIQGRKFSAIDASLSGQFKDDTLEILRHTFGFNPDMLKKKETDKEFMEDYIFNHETGLLESLTEEGITIDVLKELPGTKYKDYTSLEYFFRDNMNADSINILFDDIFKLLSNAKIEAGLKKSKKVTTKKKRNKRKKRKHTRKKRVQKGGFPCLTCLSPIFAGAGLSATGIMMSSSSSSSDINGRKSVKRQEKYKITKNGKTHKREFKQNNKRVYDGKKMSEYDNLKEANEAYNDLIKKCKAKGFQKC